MDILRILAQLREQLANVDAAIAAMERLQGEKRRRGRPPAAAPPVQESRNPLPGKRRKSGLRGGRQE